MIRTNIYTRKVFSVARLREKNGRKHIIISFPFSYETLKKVKTLSGRRFDNKEKYWLCPATVDNYNSLVSWDFKIHPDLKKFFNAQFNEEYPLLKEFPGMKLKLYDYQKQGISFLNYKKGRALLADEMGLGKTIQVISWIHLNKNKHPFLIICPASLKENWKQELLKSSDIPEDKIQVIYSNTDIKQAPVNIINFDLLNKFVDVLCKTIKPNSLIIDEIHYIKNSNTLRTKAVKKLAKKCFSIIGISGTPIINRPVEFYNIIKIINPALISDKLEFGRRYCDLKHNGFGWDYSGASNLKELYEFLTSTIMLRRLKKDVLKELPDKIKMVLPIKMRNEREYLKIKNDFIVHLKETKGKTAANKAAAAETLVKLGYLKKYASQSILPNIIQWIKDFMEGGGKLVVFAIHKDVIDVLMKEFGFCAVKIDGSTPPKHRTEIVNKFQNDYTCRLFIGNIKAAGVGLTLTAAHNVLFTELPMTPGELDQAGDRCHRISQKFPVNIIHMIAKNSIMEDIMELLDKKSKILNAVLDGGDVENVSILKDLIKKYNEKN